MTSEPMTDSEISELRASSHRNYYPASPDKIARLLATLDACAAELAAERLTSDRTEAQAEALTKMVESLGESLAGLRGLLDGATGFRFPDAAIYLVGTGEVWCLSTKDGHWDFPTRSEAVAAWRGWKAEKP